MNKMFKSKHEKYKKKYFNSFYNKIKKKEKKEEKERESYLNILSSTLNLPSDILTGDPIITIIGRNEISIENYRRIIEYTNKNIKILTNIGSISIQGKDIRISYFGKDEMKIAGRFELIKHNGVDV